VKQSNKQNDQHNNNETTNGNQNKIIDQNRSNLLQNECETNENDGKKRGLEQSIETEQSIEKKPKLDFIVE